MWHIGRVLAFNWRVSGLIPSQGHVPQLRLIPSPGPGMCRRQLVNVCLSHGCLSLPSLPFSLKTNGKKCPWVRINKNKVFYVKSGWVPTIACGSDYAVILPLAEDVKIKELPLWRSSILSAKPQWHLLLNQRYRFHPRDMLNPMNDLYLKPI